MADAPVGSVEVEVRALLEPYLRDMERARKEAQAFHDAATRHMQGVSRATDQLNRSMGAVSRTMVVMGRTALALAGGLGIREVIRYADTWSDLTARVRLAIQPTEDVKDVMDRLAVTARRTYSDLNLTAEAFLRNASSMKELGLSTAQQLDFQEALNNALVVSGAKGQRAEAVINAITKSMSAGRLMGQEFNTVLSLGGQVADILRESLGKTTGELREMSSQGEITREKIFVALIGSLEEFRKKADSMPATIQDSLILLRNAFMQFIGTIDQARGTSGGLAKVIIEIGDYIKSPSFIKATDEWATNLAEAARNATPALQFILSIIQDMIRQFNALPPWMQAVGVVGALVGGSRLRLLIGAMVLVAAGIEKLAGTADTAGARMHALGSEIVSLQQRIDRLRGGEQERGQTLPTGALISVLEARIAEKKAELARLSNQAIAQAGTIPIIPPTPPGGKTDLPDFGEAPSAELTRRRQEAIEGLGRELEGLEPLVAKYAEGAITIKEFSTELGVLQALSGLELSLTDAQGEALAGLIRRQREQMDIADERTQQVQDEHRSMQEDIEIQTQRAVAWDQGTRSIKDATIAFEQQGEAMGLTGFAAAELYARQQLLNIAEQNGIPLTDELRAEVDELAAAYGTAARATEIAAKSHAEQVQIMDQVRYGFESIGVAALSGADSFSEAIASMLKDIAVLIVRLLVVRPLVESVFGPAGTAGNVLSSFFHGGGVVGTDGHPQAMVNAAAFAGAPRAHSGAMIGPGGVRPLRSDERPIIAQVGEMILSRDQVRAGGRPIPVEVRVQVDAAPELMAQVHTVVDGKVETFSRRILPTRVSQIMDDPRGR